MNSRKVLILGVTASGKSGLAYNLAKNADAEIVSVDSMKIYRRMDIGTAKASAQLRQKIKYHLIDVVEPSESFSVATYLKMMDEAVADIQGRGKSVIAVGGTALYIKAMIFGLFEGPGNDPAIRAKLQQQAEHQGWQAMHEKLSQIDPEAAERIHLNDAKRVIRALEVYELTGKPISSFQNQWGQKPIDHGWTIIGIRRPKETESQRINVRVQKMVTDGLLDEAEALAAEEKPLSEQAQCAIGYAEMFEHLAGKMTFDEAVERIKINTRKFAKAQRTWFKTFANVHWLNVAEGDSPQDVLVAAETWLVADNWLA